MAILATGDELAGPDDYEQVRAGRKIADSNSPGLAAQVREAGGEPIALGIAADDPRAVEARIREAPAWDALVTSAGVSVGERDPVKAALEALGLERDFWRVRVRPGSALLFGRVGDRPVWGVPGNPVSAMISFEAFIRPALRKMAGHARLERRSIPAVAGEKIGSAADLTHFYRVRLEVAGSDLREPAGLPVARLTGPQGSGMLHSMAAADALLVVPEGVAGVEEGEEVEVLSLTR